MKRHYRDIYGCTASVQIHRDGTATLRIFTSQGYRVVSKEYASERGARIAMGRYVGFPGGWEEVK